MYRWRAVDGDGRGATFHKTINKALFVLVWCRCVFLPTISIHTMAIQITKCIDVKHPRVNTSTDGYQWMSMVIQGICFVQAVLGVNNERIATIKAWCLFLFTDVS